jgi:hypothetical protein
MITIMITITIMSRVKIKKPRVFTHILDLNHNHILNLTRR